MKRKNFFRSMKAVSPVIATIILVAISIVMAISVAYWALGIGSSFTKFEKIQYTSSYATTNTDDWVITVNVKNTGTATASINNIFLNGQPYDTYASTVPNPTPAANGVIATIDPGASETITMTLGNSGTNWVSGMSVQLDIMTAAGNSYPTTVNIP